MELGQVCWASHHPLPETAPWAERKETGCWILFVKKGGDKNAPIQSSPWRKETRGEMVLWFWGHTACVALGLSYTSLVLLSTLLPPAASIPRRATSLYLLAKSYWGSAHNGQASQWTKRNSPVCPICFSSSTLTSSTSTSLGAPPILSHLIPVTGLLLMLVPQIQNTLIPIPSLALIQAQICLGSVWHITAFLSPVRTTW